MAFKVLVFNGPGICPDSIHGLGRDLHYFLSPNYWIGEVDQAQLRSGEWVHTCALLVLPHCSNDEAYTCLGQDAEAIQQICNFVHGGRSFLGIGGGASFASARATWAARANWEGRMIWTKPLGLWPGTSAGPWSHGEAHAHEFFFDADGSRYHCYLFWKGGGEFRGGHWKSILARYNDNRSVAAIHCVSGEGNVVLWHARLECVLTAQVIQETRMRVTDEVIRVIYSLPTVGLNTKICIECRATAS
jgi:glutamine amidotransferase-like uncharacterized protein